MGSTPLVSCRRCTVSYLQTMASEQDLATYYEGEYRVSAQDRVSTERRRLFRLPEQVALVARLSAVRSPPTSVLDVGCDKGYFLDEMRRHGYSVAGVEPARAARGYCAAIGLPVKKSLDEVEGAYGIITLWHTLEHIPEPVALMRRLFDFLEPGGVVAVRVPDFGCPWRKLLRDRWVWFQPRNHCFHYTARALRTLLERCGGRVLEVASQRPNNTLTHLSWELANRTFAEYMGVRPTLRSSLGRRYEDLTGVELLAVAEKPLP